MSLYFVSSGIGNTEERLMNFVLTTSVTAVIFCDTVFTSLVPFNVLRDVLYTLT